MKKNAFSNTITILIAIPLIFFGCSEYDQVSEFPIEDHTNSNDGMMILGEKLDNPYTLSNMRSALDNLKKSGEIPSGFEITPTHLYIRFLPKDGKELNWFIDDATMEMFDYPMDYEILKPGQYYHDPDIPDGKPTWLYTSIPIDFKIPEFKHEILDTCYIPDFGAYSILKNNISEGFLNQLEIESFRLTGNLDNNKKDLEEIQSGSIPEGYFRVHDTYFGGLDPIQGVKVRVNNFVKWDTDYTNYAGYYQMSKSYTSNVYYSIIFENTRGFKIWGDRAFLAPAKYEMGYHTSEGHSKDFWQDSQGWRWAVVNNAAYSYWDICYYAFSISRPPADIRIWVFDKDSSNVIGSAPMLRRTWGLFEVSSYDAIQDYFFATLGLDLTISAIMGLVDFVCPDITMTMDADYSIDRYVRISEICFHELSHASHWTRVGNDYWMDYINYIIDNDGYGNGLAEDAWVCGLGEMWGNYFGEYCISSSYFPTYSLLSWESDYSWFNPGYLKDLDGITDITTSEIFSCLNSSSTTIENFKTAIKTKTSYDTQVETYYSNYTDWP